MLRSGDAEIVTLPQCTACGRYHSAREMAWNKSGELVCPDCARSPRRTDPLPAEQSSDTVLDRISERAFNILGAN